MCRRQLSTFERSSKRVSSRMGVVVSLMAATVSCCYRRTLLGVVRATFCKERSACCGRGEPAQKLLQARLEHAALRVDVGAKILDPPPHLALELAQPQVLGGDELVVAALQLLRDVGDSVLEP